MPGAAHSKRLEQRIRIVDAARRLFANHGFDEVTMAEVAAAAGVARATVFNHFGSKHALVEAITEEAVVLRNYAGKRYVYKQPRDLEPILVG